MSERVRSSFYESKFCHPNVTAPKQEYSLAIIFMTKRSLGLMHFLRTFRNILLHQRILIV